MVDSPVQYDFNAEATEPRSAQRLLEIIKDAERRMEPWQTKSDRIDKLYSSLSGLDGFAYGSEAFQDKEYNLFWASVEVIKPSIYSRPPVPVVTTKFKDRKPVKRVTAELLERTAIAGFDESGIDQVMLGVRDDLVIVARGVIWLTFEDDKDGQRVCIEHLDRKDFGHSIARTWSEVDMVWRIAWLTREEARDRFSEHSGDACMQANYGSHKDRVGDDAWSSRDGKAPFYEVWDKTEKRCYWVAEGCEDYLDSDKPHLKLKKFFPCPRPAYGTLERRSLRPVPDITYIESQLQTINELTVRIHDLCEKLVVKGIIPSGTDVGNAVEAAMRSEDTSYMLIPVPAMSLTDGAKIEWLPIDMVAQAILSAVEARREIIGNVQELFGIADIMRGESEAQETAAAQKLKAQYGSVRIRDRVAELVRIARDTVEIMVEIMAEHFSFDTMADMSQMELPTNAEVKKELAGLQKAAKAELEALGEQLEQAEDPQAAAQQFQEQQQAIIAKYQPQIAKVGETVTVEMVKEVLHDDKIRPFVFDIETDSTIYPDEQAEKESRNEFMTAFVTASQALAPLAMSGPAGAKVAGGLIKFQLGPYRAGRELEGLIDEWVDSLENAPQQQGNPAEEGLVQAQLQIAQAEAKKADAAVSKVEADTQLKVFELEQKQQSAATTADENAKKFVLEMEKTRATVDETNARIEKIFAEIQKLGIDANNQSRQQDREDYKTVEQTQQNAINNAQAVESQAFDQQQAIEGNMRADRGEDRADRQQGFAEQQGDRQQTLAERQTENPDA